MRHVRWDRTVRRGARLLGLLGLVLATPSCITQMLWEIDTPVSRVVHLDRTIPGQVVFEAEVPASGSLLVGLTPDPQEEAAAVPDFAGLAAAGSRWRLDPEPESDPGRLAWRRAGTANVIAARQLLGASPAVRLADVVLAAERARHDGRLVTSHATLRLSGRVDPASVRRLPPEEFGRALQSVVRPVPRVDHMPFEVLGPGEPALLAACVARLRALNPRAWAAEPRPAHGEGAIPTGELLGVAWLTADQRPVRNAAHARAVMEVEESDELPFAEQLDRLGRLQLLAVVRRGDGEAAFALRADRVFELGAFAFDPLTAQLTHESRWLVRPIAGRDSGAPGVREATAGRRATGELRLRCLDLREEKRHGGDLFAKILLTPLTVVADVVSLTAVVWLWGAITDDD